MEKDYTNQLVLTIFQNIENIFFINYRNRPSSINMKKLNIFHPKKRPNSQELQSPTAPTDTLGRIVNAKEEVCTK